MNVAVLGLGRFGRNLARKLYEMRHTVTVVDIDPKAVASMQKASEQAVVADCGDRESLERIGLGLMDTVVVALGHDMAASIMVTLLVKDLGVKSVVCRAVTPEHERILKRLGADRVVFPERDIATRLAMSLSDPNLLDYLSLSEDFGIAEIASPAWMTGKSLIELDLRRKYGVTVVAVRELVPERTHLVIKPDFVIKDSDLLVVIGPQDNLDRLRSAK